jgi:trehalose synthase
MRFTMEVFVPPDFPVERVEIIPPAIDPLSPKNLPLDDVVTRQVLGWIGIRTNRPLVTQVSRFDPWKDPLGVIAAYRLVREEMPDVQLTLVGSMATDDPEGWDVYRQIVEASRTEPLIHVFTNLTGVGNIEVNAFQRLSHVMVVAGRAGGIPLQMADGVGGILVDGVEECAAGILTLLRDPERAAELGRRARERVREHFLLPRLLLNEVSLMEALAADRPIGGRDPSRDPVCGMAVAEPRIATTFAGREWIFCSEACRVRFHEEPRRYAGNEDA